MATLAYSGTFTPCPPRIIFVLGDNSRMVRAIFLAFLKLGIIKLIPM